jgi:hypothetical protein
VSEKRLEELYGGPCDGLVLEVYETDMTIFPGPHHLRECGITEEHYDPTPMYVRARDGKIRYVHDAAKMEQS